MPDQITRDMLFLLVHRPLGESRRDGFIFRKNGEPFRLTPPIDWNQDPFGDRNWQFNLHALRMLDPAIDKHLRTGATEPMKYALRWILNWKSASQTMQDNEFAWHDMACGLRTARIAYIFQHARSGSFDVTPRQLSKLRKLLREHIAKLSDRDFLAYNNHALFQIVGLYAAGLALGGRAGTAARDRARTFLKDCVSKWFTASGVHTEHSPEYHAFITRELSRLPFTLREPDLDAMLKRASRVTDSFIGLDRHLYEIGDTCARATPKTRGAGKPIVLGGVKTNILDVHKDGYVIARTRDESLVAYAAAYSLVHKHADDLAFIWSDANGPFFIDGGKFGYDKDDWRRYFASARAHNTVSLKSSLIGPETLEFPPEGSGFTALEIDADGLSLTGEVARPGLFEHQRTLHYVPGKLIKIDDRVRNHTWHAAESILNLDGTVELNREGRNRIIAQRGTTRIDISWRGGVVDLYSGSQEPLYGWRSRRYKQREACHALVLRRTGPQVRLKWRISITTLDHVSFQR